MPNFIKYKMKLFEKGESEKNYKLKTWYYQRLNAKKINTKLGE